MSPKNLVTDWALPLVNDLKNQWYVQFFRCETKKLFKITFMKGVLINTLLYSLIIMSLANGISADKQALSEYNSAQWQALDEQDIKKVVESKNHRNSSEEIWNNANTNVLQTSSQISRFDKALPLISDSVWGKTKKTEAFFSRQDSLFIIASSGEPRFEEQRISCEKILLQEGKATLDYLVEHRLKDQTPRRRHYVEGLFSKMSDSGKVSAPRDVLIAALPKVADSTLAFLLYIASKMGDTSLQAQAPAYLYHDSLAVRLMAIRILGSYPNRQNEALLIKNLASKKGLELFQYLWALEQMTPIQNWKSVIFAMGDKRIINRNAARSIIGKQSLSWKTLEASIPKRPTQDELREWILLALDIKGPGSMEFISASRKKFNEEELGFLSSRIRGDASFAKRATKLLEK